MQTITRLQYVPSQALHYPPNPDMFSQRKQAPANSNRCWQGYWKTQRTCPAAIGRECVCWRWSLYNLHTDYIHHAFMRYSFGFLVFTSYPNEQVERIGLSICAPPQKWDDLTHHRQLRGLEHTRPHQSWDTTPQTSHFPTARGTDHNLNKGISKAGDRFETLPGLLETWYGGSKKDSWSKLYRYR